MASGSLEEDAATVPTSLAQPGMDRERFKEPPSASSAVLNLCLKKAAAGAKVFSSNVSDLQDKEKKTQPSFLAGCSS